MVEKIWSKKIGYDEGMGKVKTIGLVILVVLLAGDVAYLNWKTLGEKRSVAVIKEEGVSPDGEVDSREWGSGEVAKQGVLTGDDDNEVDDCGKACVEKLIDEKLADAEGVDESVPTATPTPTSTVQVVSTPTVSQSRVETVSLAAGSASGGDWVKVGGSEKWLDVALYGELVSATWQGWLEVKDGNGIAYARIYDATNNRAVDGSEVSNSSAKKASFYSANLSLWRGQNQYYIQVKSSTGYEVSVEGAKLKLEVR